MKELVLKFNDNVMSVEDYEDRNAVVVFYGSATDLKAVEIPKEILEGYEIKGDADGEN